MTLIQQADDGKEDTMNDTTMKEDLVKSSRPVRNRRYTRLVTALQKLTCMSHYFQHSV